MKKYSILFCLFLQMAMAFAQAPEKMSYQAVVRNNNNVLVSNHSVGMRISILQGSATGTAVYTETQTPTTNANGLIAIEIGTGTVVSGTFANIDWANGPYFVKTETDPNGGTAYTLTSSNQLLSVPYALYAKKTDNSKKSDTAKYALNGIPSGATDGQSLTFCNGEYVWSFNGQCPGKIQQLNCNDTINYGTLYSNVNATSNGSPTCSTTIGYTGGNYGVLESQTVQSTGVTGLTASYGGEMLNGNGVLTIYFYGTPNSTGTAYFQININNKTCLISRKIINTGTYNSSNVYCNGIPTIVNDIVSPSGKTWMDRNLGASRAATSSTDTLAYGDLYQWGRAADGHQCRNSSANNSLSSIDNPNHNNFIMNVNFNPGDWRIPQNENLWQGVNGINNPCPGGYRMPTETELNNEAQYWSNQIQFGGQSLLKITITYYRDFSNGIIINSTKTGGQMYAYYWTSSIGYNNNGVIGSKALYFDETNKYSMVISNNRGNGASVRCIKN
jgi:uncharacterized protein (TIGR02145 family)